MPGFFPFMHLSLTPANAVASRQKKRAAYQNTHTLFFSRNFVFSNIDIPPTSTITRSLSEKPIKIHFAESYTGDTMPLQNVMAFVSME
jgi:hypothetical protein